MGGGQAGEQFSDSYGVADSIAAHAVRCKPPVKACTRSNLGVERLLCDVRLQLCARGCPGMAGLAREFRIADCDGSKRLSLIEFKKAARELALEVSDADLRALFDWSDKDSDGFVWYEEFLRAVRPVMNARRLALVRRAFDVLDADDSGAVEPREIARSYDASRHPEVLAGRSTQDAVLREFLDTFTVGTELDTSVTREEFENYYANVSCEVDCDDDFELLMRNAWHLSCDGDDDGTGTAGRCAKFDCDPFVTVVKPHPRTFREVTATQPAGGGVSVRSAGSLGASALGLGSLSQQPDPRSTGKKIKGYADKRGMFKSQISFAPQVVAQRPRGSSSSSSGAKLNSKASIGLESLGSVLNSGRAGTANERPPDDAWLEEAGDEQGASSSSSSSSRPVQQDSRDATAVLDRVRARLRELGAAGVAGVAPRRPTRQVFFAIFVGVVSFCLRLVSRRGTIFACLLESQRTVRVV